MTKFTHIEYAEVVSPQRQAEIDARQRIIDAYNKCVTGKSMTADDFAKHLLISTTQKITDVVSIFTSSRILSRFQYAEELTLNDFVESSLSDSNEKPFKLLLTDDKKKEIEEKATKENKTPSEILAGEIQIALQVHGSFEALRSQYGNNEIKDNLKKVEAEPTVWEKIIHFINEYLLLGFFQTNVDDKNRYKANAKSFVDKVIESDLKSGNKMFTL